VFDQHEHWRQESASQRQIFIGPANALESILRTTKACRLAVAERDVHQWRDYHSFRGIPHVMLPTDLEHHPTERMHLSEDAGEVSLHCHSALTNPWSLTLKRTMDLVLILATAPFWAPLMGAIAIALKVLDPGPLFYKQSRVGRFRKPFEALKFRSMVCDADSKLKKYLDDHPEMQAEWDATHKLKDDPRVTSIGKFLRKTSLDELPQLLNVLLGEMSLVGPRPIIDCSNYDREYIQENPEVFELYQMVRPGITGLWQVSGRNATSYQQRIAFDRFYLHNWTLNLDIFILWRTLKTALFREGAC
jgi:Undecaprenyl-phosphate galactose phosphotransferase WbaP